MTQTYGATWYDQATGKKNGSNRAWRQLRELTILNRGSKCERCGITQAALHAIWMTLVTALPISAFSLQVHHKNPNGARIVPMDELEVLCPDCHKAAS